MADRTIENSSQWVKTLMAVPENAEHCITHTLPNSWREPGYQRVPYGAYCHAAASCISELLEHVKALEERINHHTGA